MISIDGLTDTMLHFNLIVVENNLVVLNEMLKHLEYYGNKKN